MISNTFNKRYSFLALFGAFTVLSGCSLHHIVKAEPQPGLLQYGQVVYVDDGSCPSGELKKLTGGDNSRGISRQVQCVKRPQ